MNADPAVQSEGSLTISYEEFRGLVSRRAQALLSMGDHLRRRPSHQQAMTRPFLGNVLSHAIYLEELLDAYGARSNRTWHGFRALVAAMKQFAGVGYELLHIYHCLPTYQLLPIEEDFPAATEQALQFVRHVLWCASGGMLEVARRLEMPVPDERRDYTENLPPGRLPRDRAARENKSVSETVTRLATAFLNLAAESDMLHVAGRARPKQYASCVPDPISEESLRHLEQRFHNLQSLYDTWVSATQTESVDPDLPVLRGHISVVYHLVKTATDLVHYYERHVLGVANGPDSRTEPPLVAPELLLTVLMNYSIAFASHYIASAQCLCQDMLRRYAEVGSVDVPVPRYRGFHVRPSTLVAKIVLHYGSEVRMELDGERYDASTPLEIFRANEKINARKRRWLADEIGQLPVVNGCGLHEEVHAVVQRLVMQLAAQGRIVIYEQPLQLPDALDGKQATLLQCVVEEIARLQACGKIDIQAELTVRFVGDRRVLADLKLLAENGYGEDNFGNNIPLPLGLSYLRR